jgi:hypothetical protein
MKKEFIMVDPMALQSFEKSQEFSALLLMKFTTVTASCKTLISTGSIFLAVSASL